MGYDKTSYFITERINCLTYFIFCLIIECAGGLVKDYNFRPFV